MLHALLGLLVGLCLALGGACFWLFRLQQQLARQLGEQQAAGEARLQKRLAALERRLDAYQAGSVRMGEELRALREQAAPLADRLTLLEQRDPNGLSYSQAARLVSLGASVDDLTRTCGISQAEAELMRRLHQGRSGRD